MLEALRRGATGLLAKLLLGLLVVSFAIWGVADVFRGYSSTAVGKVGKREVSEEEYKRALANRLQLIEMQRGMRLTTEQARTFGITNDVLMALLREHLLDTHVDQLGLGLSDTAVAELVRRDPQFKGIDGNFNRGAFDMALRRNGLNEEQYFKGRREGELREMLGDALQTGIVAPPFLIELLHKHYEEQRSISYVTLTPDKVPKPTEPTATKLKEFYDQTRKQHVVPETRGARVLLLTLDEIKRKYKLSDEEIKAEYERTKDSFATPEKRHILQLGFPNKAAAEAALPKLAAAKSFEEGAQELGFKGPKDGQPAEYDLGVLAASEIIDPKIAEAAFALPKDTTSGVVEGALTTAILRVTEIVPSKAPTLDEMKDRIRDTLVTAKVRPELGDMHDKVDDERAARQPLKAIADKLGVGLVEIASIDKAGNGPDGKPVLAIAEAPVITRAIFDGAVGIDREAIELGNNGYAWVEVLSVTPERQKSLEEVTEQLKTILSENEIRRALQDKARQFVERIAKGETLDAIAAELGVTVQKTRLFKRTETVEGLTPGADQQSFGLAVGYAGAAPAPDPRWGMLIVLNEVKPAGPPTAQEIDRLRDGLLRHLQNDVVEEYLSGLQDKVGVSINQLAYNRALGLDPTAPATR
jgi:peptidyl-prolyl cis-trans isomerase D